MRPLLTLLAALFLAGPARAGERWRDRPIDPKVITDVTAYTVGAGRWHLGAWEQSFGLLDNVDVGTRTLLFLVGLPNAEAKVTAIRTRRLDASFQAGVVGYDIERNLGVPGGTARLVPLGWTASWIAHERVGVHFGQGWWMVRVRGELPATAITGAIAEMTGADVFTGLDDELDQTALYAGADVTLQEAHLALDYRLNRRDSILFTTRSFVAMHGLVAGGVQTSTETGEVSAGPSVSFTRTLADAISAMSTLSWQMSWRRLHLRLGIPIFSREMTLFAIPQAIQVYTVLGPLPE